MRVVKDKIEAQRVVIVCPMVPPSHNVLRRQYRDHHAYAELRNAWERTLHGLTQGLQKAVLCAWHSDGRKLAVDIEIRHKRMYDVDNAYASCKPILDSLQRLKFISGDAPHQINLRVTQKKSVDLETEIRISDES